MARIATTRANYTCSRPMDEFAAILDAAENVVIAHGMGWDMDGVIEKLHDAILDWARKE